MTNVRRKLLAAASAVALTVGLCAGSGVNAEVVVRGIEGKPPGGSAPGSRILQTRSGHHHGSAFAFGGQSFVLGAGSSDETGPSGPGERHGKTAAPQRALALGRNSLVRDHRYD